MTKLFEFIYQKKTPDSFSSLEQAIMEGGHDLTGYRFEFIKSIKTLDTKTNENS